MTYNVEFEWVIRGISNLDVEPEDEDSIYEALLETINWEAELQYSLEDKEVIILNTEEIE